MNTNTVKKKNIIFPPFIYITILIHTEIFYSYSYNLSLSLLKDFDYDEPFLDKFLSRFLIFEYSLSKPVQLS